MAKKYAFYAQTSLGYVIKGIFEILSECLTNDIPLKISESGITACCIDKDNRQLLSLDLPMSNFDKKYVYMAEKERTIAVHLKTFCKFIKGVKKKDSLALFLENEDSPMLGIQITPINANTDSNDGKEMFCMKIHDVIGPKIIIPKGYYYPKNMKSVAYQKMCKKMAAFERKIVQIAMQKHNYLAFRGNTDLIDACVECGDIDEDDDTPLYEANFGLDMLNQFIKMSTLSPTIKIFAPKDPRFPLKIEVNTALGTFQAFIKTEEQIQAEHEQKSAKTAASSSARGVRTGA